jgi:UDP-3-O-[3-hydroxymyristoyl] glucosamine N-acyltransferase
VQRSLREIAQLLSAELIGADALIRGVATLELARPDELSLCFDLRQAENLRTTKASAPRSRTPRVAYACARVLLSSSARAAGNSSRGLG